MTSSCLDTGLGLDCGVHVATDVTSNLNVKGHEPVVLANDRTQKGQKEMQLRMRMKRKRSMILMWLTLIRNLKRLSILVGTEIGERTPHLWHLVTLEG